MIGFPLDSTVTFDENNIPIFDRAISSAPYRALLRSLFTDGIDFHTTDCLKVSPGDVGLSVTVSPGFCMVNGCLKLSEEPVTLQLDPAAAPFTIQNRYDLIVMRLNDLDEVRSCELAIVKGETALIPTYPALTRNEAIYEIALAAIEVQSGDTQVVDRRITDLRDNETYCGHLRARVEWMIDDHLDSESELPVMNKVITHEVNSLVDNVNVKVDSFDAGTGTLYLVGIDHSND